MIGEPHNWRHAQVYRKLSPRVTCELLTSMIRFNKQAQVNLLPTRGWMVRMKQFINVPIHGLPVSLGESTHINSKVSRVKHNPFIVMMHKVSAYMEYRVQVILV
jgi:hypothetical protein